MKALDLRTDLFTYNTACPLCERTEYRVVRHEPIHIDGFNEQEEAFFTPYKQSGPIEFRECLDCSFCYLDRLPADSSYYELIYGRIRYDYEFEFKYHGKANIFRDAKRQLKRYKQGGRLLDIGTWCGTLLEAMRDTYEVMGCELGVEAAQHGQNQGLDIHIGDFARLDLGRFDIITMIDVLEHMPDPLEVLKRVYEMLTPNGLVYIKVPNGYAQVRKENLLTRLGREQAGASFGFVHINHFSRKSLRAALQLVGFEVLEIGYAKLENRDLRQTASTKLKAKYWLHNRLANGFVLATSLLLLGPHLYVIARKPLE